MKLKNFASVTSILLVGLSIQVFTPHASPITVANGQPPADDSKAPSKPVEDDMHEFMEYVFQPPYKRLKAAVAVSEKDNATWKSIKSDALILAEAGNLLLERAPDSDAADWNKHSVSSRDFGGQLYRAAKEKNEAKMQQAYKSMLESCNACHKQFSGGDPELKP